MDSDSNTTADDSDESSLTSGGKYRAPALEKGLDILECLAQTSKPMTLAQLSSALSRSASELFRMVQVLAARGYIVPTFTGGYALSHKLLALGMAQIPTRTLVEVALPYMRGLSDEVGQSCHLTVASGDQIVVAARVEAPGDIGFSVRVGYRRALVAATSGQVLFAFQNEKTQQEWLKRLKKGATDEQIRDFIARARQTRKRGYVRAASYFTGGVVDLSAPVIGGDIAVATVNVPFVKRNPQYCTIETTLERLREIAKRISSNLGPSI